MIKNYSQIFNDINTKLLFIPWVVSDSLSILVDDGVVTLGGVVSKCSERIAVEKPVKNLVGVRDVSDEIKVKLEP